MNDMNQAILRTDISGMPLEWIHYQTAAKLYFAGQVAYTCGSLITTLRGGLQAKTGQQSIFELYSIVSTYGSRNSLFERYIPPLNNPALLRRDNYLCLYCGDHFPKRLLSRDHVTPISRAGEDRWTNVVTACKSCNNKKADMTPEEANMPLLAIPFQPTYAEYIYLQGRNILSDQMEFLSAHFPRQSPFRLENSRL